MWVFSLNSARKNSCKSNFLQATTFCVDSLPAMENTQGMIPMKRVCWANLMKIGTISVQCVCIRYLDDDCSVDRHANCLYALEIAQNLNGDRAYLGRKKLAMHSSTINSKACRSYLWWKFSLPFCLTLSLFLCCQHDF